MRPYEEIQQQVRDRLASLAAERHRDALAERATLGAPPSMGQRWLALAGLGLIRLGERLRGERWAPMSLPAGRECVSRI